MQTRIDQAAVIASERTTELGVTIASAYVCYAYSIVWEFVRIPGGRVSRDIITVYGRAPR